MMDRRDKALLIASICIVALMVVGGFLAFSFMNIDREGVACMSEPLLWAEDRMLEDHGQAHICSCVKKEEQKYSLMDWANS